RPYRVGHSRSCEVITQAAAGNDNVKALGCTSVRDFPFTRHPVSAALCEMRNGNKRLTPPRRRYG
ncbi:hypothetical protein ACFWN1_33350, partial [Streptomyces sp. NPDC058459]|uniref:hypothetical protein n=1 Tax=Streptomyces sp. NPDC058459 TaxID=3346508 RepID=UPI0036646CF5